MAKRSKDHGLPDDTIYDILVRLPVKTLCRFKCTCNSWRSLISSPHFQTDHYCHAQKNPLLLEIQRSFDPFTIHLTTYTSNEGTLVKKFSKPVPYKCSGIVPIQSCLGLVCITLVGDVKESGLIIYNPSTNVLLSLGPAQGFNLYVGFGYAYSTNEFKMVRFFHDKAREPKFRCGVFTLGTHEWRDARSPPYRFDRGCAPFLHGAIHLLPSCFLNVQEQDHIVAFDIESEEYKVIRLPQFYFTMDIRVKPCLRLTELGGSLCLPNLDTIREGEMELWLLKDYHNGEWIKGYAIQLSPLVDLTFRRNITPRPLAIRSDGSILLTIDLEFEGRGHKLLLKDYHNGEWIKGYTIQLSPLVDLTFRRNITPRPLAIRSDGSILLSIDLEFEGRGHKLLCYNPKDKVLAQMIDNDCSATLYMETFLLFELCNPMVAH